MRDSEPFTSIRVNGGGGGVGARVVLKITIYLRQLKLIFEESSVKRSSVR